jgi:S1-C subfamily serine protease
MAANEGKKDGMYGVGSAYYSGNGVKKDLEKAFKWLVQGAALGSGHSQGLLGFMYWTGKGAVKNDVKAYQWSLLASAKGIQPSIDSIPLIEERLTPSQREEGQRLAQAFKPINETIKKPKRTFEPRELAKIEPKSTGTGFAISDDGYIITNEHVAGKGATVRIRTANGVLSAKVVRVDKANDIALLKAQGVFAPLPVISSRRIRLGSTVATVGFPNTDLQGFAPKLAKGEIASLAGAQDDARHFQISVPIQPGNSGGALVDARGNVVGVVVAKLSQKTAVAVTGTLAENVNYAVKSSYLLSFLESVPEVAAKLKDPNLKDLKFVDMVEGVQQATVLVLVY